MGSVVAGITTGALNPLGPQQGTSQNNSPPVAGFGVVVPPVVDLKNETPKSTPLASDDMTAFRQKLEKLKMMKEMGILSDEDFETEKKKLLSSL